MAHPPTGAGSFYSWQARSSFVLAAILIVGCSPDSRLVSGGYQTTKPFASRVTQTGPVKLADVPAYYLVAQDQASCEVDSATYVRTTRNSVVACDWSRP